MSSSNDNVNGNGTANGHVQDSFVDGSVAISPNMPELVPELLKKVATHGISFISNDPKARTELLDAARSLVNAVETPREAMIRYCWSQSTLYACLETAVDLGLFKILSENNEPKTAAFLAEKVGADKRLISRVLKHLSALDIILETGPNEYRRTGFSTSLSLERYSDAYPCMTACITNGVLALPAQLKKTGYANPTNGKDCGFQRGFNTELHFFEWLGQNPAAANQFNNHMSAYHQGRPSWMDVGFFDVPSLFKGVNIGPEDALLVDVGGSVGHDISEFRRKWPDAPGRLVIQDLPPVIAQAKSMSLHPSVELMEHDFFTEEPLKGARAYYMHSVLHDWADSDAIKILKNLTPAMKSGYSKILINENVIPDTNAYWETTSLDIIMMSDFASTERTAEDWHALTAAAGLKIVKIWTAQRGVESLIECELA